MAPFPPALLALPAFVLVGGVVALSGGFRYLICSDTLRSSTSCRVYEDGTAALSIILVLHVSVTVNSIGSNSNNPLLECAPKINSQIFCKNYY